MNYLLLKKVMKWKEGMEKNGLRVGKCWKDKGHVVSGE